MKIASLQRGRHLVLQITYRFPHIGRKAACRSARSWGAVVNVSCHRLRQSLPIVRSKSRAIGLCAAIESFPHALHFLRYRQVTDPHFPQVIVHILTKPIKKPLAKVP